MTPANLPSQTDRPRSKPIPPLAAGDRLTRDEFERRYDAMPNLKKAELLEGVVCMPSPVRLTQHGKPSNWLGGLFFNYEITTPGVIGAANTTVRLDLDNEPQPDALLLIDPSCGGQARISADDYVEDAPELVGEVSASTASFDLNTKMHVYRRNRVQESIVWRVLDRQLDWFVNEAGAFQRLVADAEGILRSRVFPGLWLDAQALMNGDGVKLLAVLQMGIASPEHAAFVQRLQSPRE